MVISEPISIFSANVAAVHRLYFAGMTSLTDTFLVVSVMGEGETTTLASLMPAIFMMLFATASASATVAPGTITCRAAS
jgi:hypothetical protein